MTERSEFEAALYEYARKLTTYPGVSTMAERAAVIALYTAAIARAEHAERERDDARTEEHAQMQGAHALTEALRKERDEWKQRALEAERTVEDREGVCRAQATTIAIMRDDESAVGVERRITDAYERGIRDAVWPDGPSGDAMRFIAAERDRLQAEVGNSIGVVAELIAERDAARAACRELHAALATADATLHSIRGWYLEDMPAPGWEGLREKDRIKMESAMVIARKALTAHAPEPRP